MEALLDDAKSARRPRFDARTASEASIGLGAALSTISIAPEGQAVSAVAVTGQVLGKTRQVLLDLIDRLAPGPQRWRACQCPGPCDEADTPPTSAPP